MCVLLWNSEFKTNCQQNLTNKPRAHNDNTAMKTFVGVSAGVGVLIYLMQIK
jgi:hypothetical protein